MFVYGQGKICSLCYTRVNFGEGIQCRYVKKRTQAVRLDGPDRVLNGEKCEA